MRKSAKRLMAGVLTALIIVNSLPLSAVFAAAGNSPVLLGTTGEIHPMSRISSGWGFTLGLMTDGRVAAWGDNNHGQCNVPVDLSGVIAVSAGAYHALALRADGTVVAWGQRDWGQCNVPAELQSSDTANVIAMSAGGSHSLALRNDGTVVAWGFNSSGQCDVPAALSNPSTADVVAVAAGSSHSLALKSDGTVVGWGSDSEEWNELAIPADLADPNSAPPGTSPAKAIAAPWGHSLVLRDDGTVVAWGYNAWGQSDVSEGLAGVRAVAGSVTNSMALLDDGTVVVWGDSGAYSGTSFSPPAGLSGVIAISSQSAGCVALKSDYTIVAWGDTGIPEGASLVPKPEIMFGEVDKDNSFVDVHFNMPVYAADLQPLTLSNFRHLFHSNGGELFPVALTALTRTDGTAVTGGEDVLRFHVEMTGEPTGEQTVEIRPFAALSVFSMTREAMAAGQTTGPIKLNATVQKIVALEIAPDNAHLDATFNMGAYGDSGHSEPVDKDDFILAFLQNDGVATSASITDVTRIDGASPTGGETKLRFHLQVIGPLVEDGVTMSGDETIQLRAAPESVYSFSGAAMSPSRTSPSVRLSPPEPKVLSATLSPDNTYLDITFNTGVYGQRDDIGDGPFGVGPVLPWNLRLILIGVGLEAHGGISSLKMADHSIESRAADLQGGEKTIRAFINVDEVPTDMGSIRLGVEAVFNRVGEVFGTDYPNILVTMSAPAFGLTHMASNNRYVDLTFNSGVYGAKDGVEPVSPVPIGDLAPVSKDDFALVYQKGSGLTESVTIGAVTKPDSVSIESASPLSGGERVVRAFLELSSPAAGMAESFVIKPVDGNSIFVIRPGTPDDESTPEDESTPDGGIPMDAAMVTKKTYLFASRPDALTAQLAQDNSYVDLEFDFGIYGDIAHTKAVTPDHFSLSFYREDGHATAASITSVRRPDSADEAQASQLEGGETAVRLFLDVTGSPSGAEAIVVRPAAKPIHNAIGNATSAYTTQFADELSLNSVLRLISVSLSDDMAYLDAFFNTGVYGDDSHSKPASQDSFILSFARNGGAADNVTISSIRKSNAATEADALVLEGGETVLRFFLNVSGIPSGQETIQLSPSYEDPIHRLYSDSGNPIPEGQVSKAIRLGVPSPEIEYVRLAPDNRYVDVAFTCAVYGSETQAGVSKDHLKVLVTSNGGDAGEAEIVAVTETFIDDPSGGDRQPSGQRTLRFFLYLPSSASGGETIEIRPSEGYSVYSVSGEPMAEDETTGAIHLNPFPKIVSETVAGDNSYVDVTFSAGVWGDARQSRPISANSLLLTFNRGTGGSMMGATIKSVKKPDGAKDSTASELTGGEQVVRVFLGTTGIANGKETIAIDKNGGDAIFDREGRAIPLDKYVTPVKLNYAPLSITSAELSDDYRYADVHFSGGVYGAPDGETPVKAWYFCLLDNPTGVSIASVKQADSEDQETASPISGGETTLRFFLNHNRNGEATSFRIGLEAQYGGPKIYNNTGLAMSSTAATGVISIGDTRIKMLSAEIAPDNSYVDITFNKGIYGKDAGGALAGVQASDFFISYREGGVGVSITAVRRPDGPEAESASAPQGGETVLRFFLSVLGKPKGGDATAIVPWADSIFDNAGNSEFQYIDSIYLVVSAPSIVSASLSEDNRYLDVAFDTGVYGDTGHSAPVTVGSFRLLFERSGGKAANATIQAVKKPDGGTVLAASGLKGGEDKTRFFLAWDGMPNGMETIEVRPTDDDSVFSFSGGGAGAMETTGALRASTYYPEITSCRIDDANRYVDIRFNYGIYSAAQGSVSAESFLVTLATPENPSGSLLSNWSLTGNYGGTQSVRINLPGSVTALESGTLSFSLNPNEPVYSVYGAASYSSAVFDVNVNSPRPRIVSVSPSKIAGNRLQYVDVLFNTGVYGNAEHSYPVYPELFEFTFGQNGGTATSAAIKSLGNPGGGGLAGGEETVRFFIETEGFASGKETVQVRTRLDEGALIYNGSGQPNSIVMPTPAIPLQNGLVAVECAKMGDLNKYMDIVYNVGVTHKPQLGKVRLGNSDFELVFNKNGGTAQNVKVKSVRQNNSPIEADARPLEGNEKVLRFFLEVTGTPNGLETIEIRPVSGEVMVSENGAPALRASTTGPIRLVPSSGAAWSSQGGVADEPLGWMSDVYVSNSDSEALVLRNDGTVKAPVYSISPDSGSPNAKAVAAGSGFGLALKRDGTVVGWGSITVPANLPAALAIDASLSKAYVLFPDSSIGIITSEGSLETRYNSSGPGRILALSAGNDDHYLVLYDNGTVGAFGDNLYGQCVVPSGLTGVTDIAAGGGYSLALTEDGTVVGWGSVTLPGGLTGVAAISASGTGYMVLKADGSFTLYDLDGRVLETPLHLRDITDVIAVSAGENLYSIVRANGDAETWAPNRSFEPQTVYANKISGRMQQSSNYVAIDFETTKYREPLDGHWNFLGSSGPIGEQDLVLTYVRKSPFVQDVEIASVSADSWRQGGSLYVYVDVHGIPEGTEAIEIRPASSHSVYTSDGDSLLSYQKVVVPIAVNSSQWLERQQNRISAGWEHGLAITGEGTVLAWGGGEHGQADVPPNLETARQVSAGYHHSVALLSNGSIAAWGEDYYGQCDVPYGLKGIKKVDAGGYHTLALGYDGKVHAWGDNFYGQCDVPQSLSGVIDIAAGGHHSLALKSDGTVVAWGDNSFGQCTNLPNVQNPHEGSIAAGEDFSVVLVSEHAIEVRGDNSSGQCEVPALWASPTTTKAIAVSAGYRHALALMRTYSYGVPWHYIAAWGDNSMGQGVSSKAEAFAFSAGAFFNMAITEEGIVCWGDNEAGQCGFLQATSAPYFVRSELSPDNRYVDIAFSKGVYGGEPGVRGPITPDSLMLLFERGDSTESTAAVTIESVKKNDNADEALASQLTGGETAMRIFLDIKGYVAGTETIEFKAKDGSAIWHKADEFLSAGASSGILTLNRLTAPPSSWIDSVAYGSTQGETTSIGWLHKETAEANADRILVVGVKCEEKGSTTDVVSVTVNGVFMTHAASNRLWDAQMDLYYLLDEDLRALDEDLPEEQRGYEIRAEYRNDNQSLEGYSLLLCNATQMGPESIAISSAMENSFSRFTQKPLLTTHTDSAVVIEFLSIGDAIIRQDTGATAVRPQEDLTYRSTMTIRQVDDAGNISTCFGVDETPNSSDPRRWLSMALAFRNSKYPADPEAVAAAPSPILPSLEGFLPGENIAFTSMDLGMRVTGLAATEDWLVAQSDTHVYGDGFMTPGAAYTKGSRDGVVWDGAAPASGAGPTFKMGQRLFMCGGWTGGLSKDGERILTTSADGGKSWSQIASWQTGAWYSYTPPFSISGLAANSYDEDKPDRVIVGVGTTEWYLRWLGVNEGVIVHSSDNGVTWGRRYYPQMTGLKGVTCIGGRFIVWNDSNIWHSLDGVDWQLAYLNNDPGTLARFQGHITGVYERNNVLLLVGEGLDEYDSGDPDSAVNIYTSTSGFDWTRAKIVYRDPKITKDFDGFASIAYAQGTYAAAGGHYIAAATAPPPEQIDQPWEFSLYALDMDGIDYLTSINNRFYTRYAGALLSSDNLRDWYLESLNSGNGPIINFKGKAVTFSGNNVIVGYQPLYVDSLTPYVDETGVPVADPIVIGFREGVKAAQIIAKDAIRVSGPDGRLHPIAVSFKDGNLVLTPDIPFDYNSAYTVLISEGSVVNTVNTKANMLFTYSFTTTQQVGPPQIVSTSLGDGADVPAEEPIVIRFDRGIDAGASFAGITIRPVVGGNPGSPLEVEAEVERSIVILTAEKPLASNQTYVVTLPQASVKDYYGYSLDEAWSMEFTTGADVVPPRVAWTTPPNYGERVASAPTIEVRFSESVKEGADFGKVTLKNIRSSEETEVLVSILPSIQVRTSLHGEPTTDSLLIELPGNSVLELHHTYRVTIPKDAITDIAGNQLSQDFSFVFTEEIRPTGPVLLESSPKANAMGVDVRSDFVLLWDRPIGEGYNYGDGVNGYGFKLAADGYPDIALTPQIGRNRLTLRHQEPMEYGVTYTLRIVDGAVSDRSGVNGNKDNYYLDFTAEEQRVAGTLPARGASDVLINSIPEVRFAAAPAGKGYEFGSIVLTGHGAAGDAVVSLRPRLEGDRLLLVPEEELSPDTLYTVVLPRGAVRFADGRISNAYEFSFTTGAGRKDLRDFTFVGTVQLLNALFVEDRASFDATGCLEGASEFVWDFADETGLISDRQVTHTLAARGTYRVILTIKDASGGRFFLPRDVNVVKKSGKDSTVIDVTPRAPALLNPGDSVTYVARLTSSGIPMLYRDVQVTRTYPAAEGKEPESLATLKTDESGRVEYTATFPEDCHEYYITFTYEGVTTRRTMKNAAGLSELSGYVMNDKGQTIEGALVSLGNRGTVTDADGFYRISDILPGIYSLKVSSEFHYDFVTDASIYQKNMVKNIALLKVVYTLEPAIKQVIINRSAAADRKTFYFLEGIDAPLSVELMVDWRGHEPGYLELRKAGTLVDQVDFRTKLSANAKDFRRGDRLTAVCYTADGITSQVDLDLHMVEKLPGDFPFELDPVYIDGKYITERYINLLPVRTPVISSIPILAGGPFAFLAEPVHVYGEMGVDGSFYVVTDAAGLRGASHGLYAENNIVQKFLAKRAATSAKEKKEIAKRQSKSFMGSVEMDSRIGVSFYWKYDLAQDDWAFDAGTLHLGISVNASGSASYGIPGAPFGSFYIGGDFEVILDTYLNAVGRSGGIGYGGGTLDLSHLFIEISGGFSALVASAGVYFNGTGAVRVDFPSGDTDYYIEVNGGVKASALGWSVRWDYMTYTWGDRSPWQAQSGARTFAAAAQSPEFNLGILQGKDGPGKGLIPTNASELEPMSRDYLEDQPGWLAGGDSGPGTQGSGRMRVFMAMAAEEEASRMATLRSSTFPYTSHSVAPYGVANPSGAIMVLVEDEPSRPTLNQTRAKYSFYDGSNWSYPLPIGLDDSTADFAPVVAATGSGAIAAWENLNGVLRPDSELGDALAIEEIAVATYNAASKTWVDVHDLTRDNYHDHAPKIAATGDEGLLVWIKSRSNDYNSALSDSYIAENDVMFSKWNGSSFGEPEAVATFEQPIVNASLAYENGKGLYVFSLDGDGALNTISDQEVYAMTYSSGSDSWSSLVRLSDNSVRDSNPQACFLNGKAFVVWEQDGSIVYVEDAQDTPSAVKTAVQDTIMQNTFAVAVNESDVLALVGPGTAGSGGTDLYQVTYDAANKIWSKEVRLTEDYSANRSPSAAFAADELITVYNRDIIVDTVNPANGKAYPTISNKADLRMVAKSFVHDLAVVEDETMLSEDNPFPGGLVEISAVVENKGSFTETAAKVAFYEGDPLVGGRQIGQVQTITDLLAPGDRAVASVPWEIPATMPADGIYVVVDPLYEISDARRSDNTAHTLLLRPDLELTDLQCVALEDGKYIITVKASNVSAVDVAGAVVSLYYGDGEGGLTLIEDLDAVALKAGQVVEMAFLWTPDAEVLKDGKADLFAIVDIPDQAMGEMMSSASITFEDEIILDNNLMMLTVHASPPTPPPSGGDEPSEDDGGDEGSGDASLGGTPTIETVVSGNAVTVSTIVAAVVGGHTAAATVTRAQASNAIGAALDEARRQGQGAVAQVEFRMEAPSGVGASSDVNTAEVILTRESVREAAGAGIGALTVSSPLASVSFDAAALSTLSEEATDDVIIAVSRVEPSPLSPEAQRMVGDRPVLDIDVTSGGRTISQFGGDVSVSVPYIPREGEDVDAIVVYYVNASGQLVPVSDCVYDPATGRVTFSTRHFSQYAVGYNKVTFGDVAPSSWYERAVGFIAARGITTGTGSGNFGPEEELTRGQFMVMLMRAFGIGPDADAEDNFADAGDTYYTGYLAEAKRLAISKGIGDNLYAPDREITRQEMFTLLHNVLKIIGKLPQGSYGRTLSSFSDAGEIAPWAEEAMALMVQTGTVIGSNGRLSPTSTATRAEMAQVIYNLLSK